MEDQGITAEQLMERMEEDFRALAEKAAKEAFSPSGRRRQGAMEE